jgi:hypothetical protein
MKLDADEEIYLVQKDMKLLATLKKTIISIKERVSIGFICQQLIYHLGNLSVRYRINSEDLVNFLRETITKIQNQKEKDDQ